jgi:hypothetical protein
LDTFHGWHSAANVDFRPIANAKVIAIRPSSCPAGALARAVAVRLGLAPRLFVVLVGEAGADA